jgi:uncharacterized protein YggT (Ycf19 family)
MIRHSRSQSEIPMGLINSILNLAGLLLWVGWRDLVANSLLKTAVPTPLVRTLRRAGPLGWRRWRYLGALVVLLGLRAMIYRWLGPSVNSWTPHLRLGPVVTIPFRSESLQQMAVFSLLSFGVILGIFYLVLLLLSLVNRSLPDSEYLQKLIRVQLGLLERLPWLLKLLLPFLATLGLWLALNPLFIHWELIPSGHSLGVKTEQGLLIGLGFCLPLEYLVVAVLLLHFLNSYIYFGNNPFWNFINQTARRLLSPLRRRWLPLQVGRMDLAPLLGLILVFLLGEIIRIALPRLFPA